jgi:hypothetical protein
MEKSYPLWPATIIPLRLPPMAVFSARAHSEYIGVVNIFVTLQDGKGVLGFSVDVEKQPVFKCVYESKSEPVSSYLCPCAHIPGRPACHGF